MSNKELLKYLCEILPYGVKIKIGEYSDYKLVGVVIADEHPVKVEVIENEIVYKIEVSCNNVRPYLRPMSSMTEEEKKEYTSYCFEQPFLQKDKVPNLGSVPMCIDWLNAHRFDFRNLIEKGLAIEAPKEMYNF